MEQLLDQILHLQMLNQFWLTLLLLIPIVLISRTVVAGTRYSPILIVVVFGLAMGVILVISDVATPGLPELPIVDLMSRLTVTALIVTFFVGGQEIRKMLSHQKLEIEDLIIQSDEEVILGTQRTQLMFIVRTFFILLGIEGVKKLILGSSPDDPIHKFYPIISYIGIVGSIILVDYKADIKNKGKYLRKGFLEIVVIVMILVISTKIAESIKPIIGLPQIFFVMIVSSILGMMLPNRRFGPTVRALLFAGLPVVLSANFMVGGSRMIEAFKLTGMKPIMTFGLFGQVFWMFFGIALLIFFGGTNHIRNLAPGMAGGLSHSGLTGACTAGDLGKESAYRAPIMINIPFLGHVFVFSILAASAEKGQLMIGLVVPVVIIGILLTIWSLRILKRSNGEENFEIKSLMIFSLGWQLIALFGSFAMLYFSGMSLGDASVATTSSISHFGLFAAVQGGMFGDAASEMIAFIFAMPFLIHPFVFGMFGKAVDNNGKMPVKPVYTLALIGIIGVIYSLAII